MYGLQVGQEEAENVPGTSAASLGGELSFLALWLQHTREVTWRCQSQSKIHLKKENSFSFPPLKVERTLSIVIFSRCAFTFSHIFITFFFVFSCCCFALTGSAAATGTAEIHRVRHVWSHQGGIQFPPSPVSQASRHKNKINKTFFPPWPLGLIFRSFIFLLSFLTFKKKLSKKKSNSISARLIFSFPNSLTMRFINDSDSSFIVFLCVCSLKLECEKLASEKTEMQRHYVMVYWINEP